MFGGGEGSTVERWDRALQIGPLVISLPELLHDNLLTLEI